LTHPGAAAKVELFSMVIAHPAKIGFVLQFSRLARRRRGWIEKSRTLSN
jgi:hypothetical protein